MTTVPVLNTESILDRDLFETALLQALQVGKPTAVGVIEYPAHLFETWRAEGQRRTAINKKIGTASQFQDLRQRIDASELTADEIGRLGEGPVELMLGLNVAAVNETGTEPDADVMLGNLRLDIKATAWHRKTSFSVQERYARSYDALILVRTVAPGLAEVWTTPCVPERWTRMQTDPRKHPFYLINCPAISPTIH